jgi:hypothetical protein
MSVALPQLRVGDPIRFEAVSVFPLFGETNGNVEYRLADEALADKEVVVTEISEAGSVPELLVENKGHRRILFLEGDELVGAKQNRVLNTSVLVAANTKSKIPVSCVERGRWRLMSHAFGYSGSASPSDVRYMLKQSVGKSLKANFGHRSDQGGVWAEVAKLQGALNVDSETEALSDAFEGYKDHVADFRERVKYIPGATGFAVAVGDRVVSVDVFDKPATCEKVWPRVLSGAVFDILCAKKTENHSATADVENTLSAVRDLKWEKTVAAGDGEEYRAETPGGDFASALMLDNTIVHGSWVAARN